MPLSTPQPEHVAQFRAFYFQEFGVTLETEEATRQLTDLVQLYYLIGGHEVSHLRKKKLRE